MRSGVLLKHTHKPSSKAFTFMESYWQAVKIVISTVHNPTTLNGPKLILYPVLSL